MLVCRVPLVADEVREGGGGGVTGAHGLAAGYQQVIGPLPLLPQRYHFLLFYRVCVCVREGVRESVCDEVIPAHLFFLACAAGPHVKPIRGSAWCL